MHYSYTTLRFIYYSTRTNYGQYTWTVRRALNFKLISLAIFFIGFPTLPSRRNGLDKSASWIPHLVDQCWELRRGKESRWGWGRLWRAYLPFYLWSDFSCGLTNRKTDIGTPWGPRGPENLLTYANLHIAPNIANDFWGLQKIVLMQNIHCDEQFR